MSIRDETEDNSQKQRKKHKHVTIKQSPVLHTGFPQVSLRGQSSKVLNGGDTVALLIKLEAKLFNHIHMADGRGRVGFAATVYFPAQVSLRNGTIRFVSSQRLQRQSEEGKTIPAWKNLSLNAAKMIFFCPIYGIYFSSIFILHDSIIIKYLLCFFPNIYSHENVFLYKMCSSLPILKRSRALPRFTVGCREIAAASLIDGGTCLIVGVCVRVRGVTVWP